MSLNNESIAVNGFSFPIRSSLISTFGEIEFDELPPESIDDLGIFNGDLKLFFEDVKVHPVPVDIRLLDNKRDAVQDPTFETAVILSIFTDRRADIDDILPDNSGDKRGWVGDQILNDLYIQDLILGSKLWLLSRSKMNNELLVRSKEYTEQCLEWMISFNIAERVDVETTKIDFEEILISILIYRPGEEDLSYRYAYNWIEQTFRKG